jgi:polyhydroxybutyrate depolymerase
MSNGGEMCYLFAYSRPERFRAISSVAGLTLSWMPQEITPSGKVPFMEIHGDDDDISMWEGDPENTGGWGAYLGVEDAVSRIAAMDGCTVADDPVELPLLDPQAPSRQVTLYRYSSPAGGGLFKKKAPEYEVLLYKVAGGHHSWHLDDFDTCEESIRFFEKYLQD